MAFNWSCPYCNRAQTVTDHRVSKTTTGVGIADLAEGILALEKTAIACSNPVCKRLTLRIRVGVDNAPRDGYRVDPDKVLFDQTLIPFGSAKPQPDFIPAPIREDYREACLIRDLSPKASATLTRRCLQGMIRDFCGITRGRLIDEIAALNEALDKGEAPQGVTEETVQAIDHVRKLGNIGAHMERDIDLIVSVDPGEAQAMIDLIELLFDEWYVARHRRSARLARIKEVAGIKEETRAASGRGEVSTA